MKVSFVIPFHNEDRNCRPMIEQVIKYAKSQSLLFEIIPVDDRSTDNTWKILESISQKVPLVKPVRRQVDSEETGNTMGRALVLGTKRASGKYIIWTMGDLADDTDTYSDIIDSLNNGYDMIFGSRYMPGGSRGNLDRLKAFLSSWGTRLAVILFHVPVHDITNAFRGFNKDLFNRIKLDCPGFAISPEFAIKAHLAGYKLGEVPTVYTNRVEGVSSFKLFRMIRSYLKIYLSLYSKYIILGQHKDFIRK
jgi:glycosyltransferase involved in cell wall biosynthesis